MRWSGAAQAALTENPHDRAPAHGVGVRLALPRDMRVAVLLVLLSACQLPLGDDDDDEIDCDALPVLALRDPRTGTCTTIGYLTNDCKACGNCVPDDLDVMDRARCGLSSRCENLPEGDCL